MRTTPGGTDALKRVLVELKRYSFSGYVKATLSASDGTRTGHVVVANGNPELALHHAGNRMTEGKVALKAVWEDSYSEACALEIHAKVDVDAIRGAYPRAGLERAARPSRAAAKTRREVSAEGDAQETKPAPTGAEEKVRRWREAGYTVDELSAVLARGGSEAAAAVAAFEAAVAQMDPLRRELDGLDEPAIGDAIAALREKARNPRAHEAVASDLARVRDEIARLPTTRGEPSGERGRMLQERARQVFEMIVRHRAAEGKPTTISESQVVEAIRGKPPTRDARTSLIRQYTFDAFVVGPSNRFAHAASAAVAKSPHTAYNPLFLTAGSGLGKTHLLNAIGNAVVQDNPRARVVYMTVEGFGNEFKEAEDSRRLAEFREKYRRLDVALVDDAQFLSGRGDVQEELFHTFNDLYAAGKQIVLTSDRPPKDIVDLEDRLISRFESGLVADIQPPEYETRLAILRRKARDEGATVAEEVLSFVARHVESNIRELGGALNRVIAFSALMEQPVSLDLAREVLRDLAEPEGAAEKVGEAARAIRPGHTYLVEEERPEHTFRLLRAASGQGRSLLITRVNPKRVREKHKLRADRVLWLTERESGTAETIAPSLERIVYFIEEYMKGGGRGAIALDGIEYLVSSNSFDSVLKFLRRLVDHTSESQFVLIVSVSPKTMKEQEVKNLEREMEALSF